MYVIISWVSFLVQLFITSLVLNRFGVRSALSVLPIAVFGASAAFIIFPVLWIASLLPIFDNSLNYSINQSAREALYVPVPAEKLYQAKGFIDIFVMRGAKVLAIGISLIVSSIFTEFSSLKWISLITLILVCFWLLVVRYVGAEYRKKTT